MDSGWETGNLFRVAIAKERDWKLSHVLVKFYGNIGEASVLHCTKNYKVRGLH